MDTFFISWFRKVAIASDSRAVFAAVSGDEPTGSTFSINGASVNVGSLSSMENVLE